MNNYLHVICDYAPGDLAWAEVYSAFVAKLPSTVRMHISSVNSFDTISTGFMVGQLALAEEALRPKDLLIFANCAPRKDMKHARTNNEGEGLLFATLKNGVQVLAVNSGYSLSFVKNSLHELWSTNVEEQGSQFRSRDYFPRLVVSACAGDLGFIVHKLSAEEIIPTVPIGVVGYIDSFGNMKTTFRSSHPQIEQLSAGGRLRVRIGGVIRAATVATGS